jgi:hypothetical protein
MQFVDFSNVMSGARIGRYVAACGGDTRKAMTLYRLNLRLSQELFTVISCFEIALRNRICHHYSASFGGNWLRDAGQMGGIFDTPYCRVTRSIIVGVSAKLTNAGVYTHYKLMAEMDFGFWRYLFAQPQFRAGGQTLLRIFPAKPTSSRAINYNHTYVFSQLEQINHMRNRIAHHEPICFVPGCPVKNTAYARQHYNLILQLFQWMQIDESELLYGLDHINKVCNCIDAL